MPLPRTVTARTLRPVLGLLVAASLAACAAGSPPITVAPVAPPASAAPTPPASAADRFVDALLARMTLREKLGQLNQFSGVAATTAPGAAHASFDQLRRGEVGSFLNVWGADTTRALQRVAVEQSRLGIPLLFAMDIIHGARTIFPVPLAEASSWDPDAAELSARVAATEAAAYGLHWTFAPMVDIARDARWGRVVEGAGEDPVLGAALAAARVRGFQGADLGAPNTLAATAKHFAGYGAAEAGRDYNTVDVSERTLRDVYLPPFHAAVCAGAASLMPAFNELSGVPAHANRWLLTDVLRGEWRWPGVVVSDWGAVGELIPHGVAADSADAARLGLAAGVDIEMVSSTYFWQMPELVRRGVVPEAQVDQATRRVLLLKHRLGLFDDPYRRSVAARERDWVLTPAHRLAARHVARRSMVLLKNTGNLLPLSPDLDTLAVIGALAADSAAPLGSWVGMGRKGDVTPVLDGIRQAVGPRTVVRYAPGAGPTSDDTTGFGEAVRVARTADAVVLVVGETAAISGEAASRASIDLPGAQLELAKRLHATGVPLVAVLMNGRPLALPWLAEQVPAILEAWFGGTEMGHAVADLLFGVHAPSGKLPVTFPRHVGQVPIHHAHRNTGRPPVAENSYTSKYLDVAWTPQWAFGHGLSYTTFGYDTPQLSHRTLLAGDSLEVAVRVTNTGGRAGEEVVQLYLRDEVASVTRPVKQLRAFRRVRLEPGQSTVVRFALRAEDLAFHDARLRRVAEPGWFRVYAGGSSAELREARFEFATADGEPVELPERCGQAAGPQRHPSPLRPPSP